MAPISVTLAPRDPPAAVVALVGEHDAYSAGRLEGELAVLLEEGRRIVVDLRDTEFIDSSTLATLLAGRRKAKAAGLGFTVVLPRWSYTQVNQLLDLTGLGSSFAIYDTVADALAAARSGNTGSVRPAA
ncbi:MAG TPA: STAS domain-containing protein [Gaiellaceae bacterium]|nr:STAS domain-containing protein [Gaiellaceae bacterium]